MSKWNEQKVIKDLAKYSRVISELKNKGIIIDVKTPGWKNHIKKVISEQYNTDRSEKMKEKGLKDEPISSNDYMKKQTEQYRFIRDLKRKMKNDIKEKIKKDMELQNETKS